MKPIVIQGQFDKATTTPDGGWRMSFTTGDEMAEAVASLSKRKHEVLYVVVMTQAQFALSEECKS
jgi:hypothetical protein